MRFSLNAFLYRSLIDPLLYGIRGSIISKINPQDRVLDIACGTGALAMAMAEHAYEVTGIDMAEDMIVSAGDLAARRGLSNVWFELQDATDLSVYHDNQFDIAVTTMAMHQFSPETALKVLAEMKRIARRVIVADYNHPMKKGPAAWMAWGMERLAGGNHYRNFRKYTVRGGIGTLFDEAGLKIESSEVRGEGVFVIAQGTVD
jgi:ubiquinone/menaquinone biosynthesis C-methylase UbiE